MNATRACQMSMQDIKSLNFEPLRAAYPELANMVGYFFGTTGD
jgi:type I restriction enzyme R subunit